MHSLTRIQNHALWPFYALTRKSLADKYKGDPNEKMLFHGARVRANMDAITNFGYVYCNSQATRAGIRCMP